MGFIKYKLTIKSHLLWYEFLCLEIVVDWLARGSLSEETILKEGYQEVVFNL